MNSDIKPEEVLLIYRALEAYINTLEDTFAYADKDFQRMSITNEIARATALRQKIGNMQVGN